jgi:hypothetical protein
VPGAAGERLDGGSVQRVGQRGELVRVLEGDRQSHHPPVEGPQPIADQARAAVVLVGRPFPVDLPDLVPAQAFPHLPAVIERGEPALVQVEPPEPARPEEQAPDRHDQDHHPGDHHPRNPERSDPGLRHSDRYEAQREDEPDQQRPEGRLGRPLGLAHEEAGDRSQPQLVSQRRGVSVLWRQLVRHASTFATGVKRAGPAVYITFSAPLLPSRHEQAMAFLVGAGAGRDGGLHRRGPGSGPAV